MIGVSRRLRDAVFVLAIAIFSCALILATPLDRLRGLSIDILTMLRWRVFGSMHKPEQSPTIVVALVVADKDRRFLRRSFALYLAPSVIEKMVTANKPPALGGEMRNVTIFFSDLAGFSSISEALTSMHWHVGGAAILPAASRRSRRSPPPIRHRRSCCAGPRNFWRIRRRPIGTPSTRWKGSDGVNRADASPAHFPRKRQSSKISHYWVPAYAGTSG